MFIIAFLGCGGGDRKDSPRVVNGILDLSNWKLNDEEVIKLSGKWNFYWKSFLPDDKPKNKIYLKVPDSWIGKKLPDGKEIPPFGYGTYKLKIIAPKGSKEEELALFFNYLGTSYRVLFKNDSDNNYIELAKGGVVGKDRKESIPLLVPAFVKFNVRKSGELLIQGSNFYDASKAGLYVDAVLGTPKAVLNYRKKLIMIDLFLIGVIFVFGLYHIVLYILRTSEKFPLLFGLFCFLIAIRTVLTSHYIEEAYPDLYIFDVYLKIEYLTFYIGLPLFITFLRSIFRDTFNKIVVRVIQVVAGIFSLIVVFTPSYIFTRSLIFYQLFSFLVLFWLLYSLVKTVVKKKDAESIIAFLGFIVIAAAAVNDILFFLQVLDTGIFIHYGLFAFIFSQATIIAISNSKARYLAEYLSHNLQKEVEKRTRELKEALEQLKEKDRIMEIELNVASDIQKSILPKLPFENECLVFDGFYQSMEKVGGDFFDIYNHGDNRISILIADVSGHGVPASLVTAMVKISFTDATRKLRSPKEIFKLVNTEILKTVKTQEYLTAFLLTIDSSLNVIYSNASHPPPVVLRKKDLSIERWDTQGLFIGAVEEANLMYEEKRDKLEPGDKILFYTDGITEQKNLKGEEFGEDRLIKLFKEYHTLSVSDIKNKIIEEWKRFVGNAKIKDDITILIVEIKESYVPKAYVPEEELEEVIKEGVALFKRGELSKSIDIFNKALAIDGDNLDVIVYLAGAYIKAKMYKEAISLLERAREKFPDDHKVWYYLSVAYYNSKDFSKAYNISKEAASKFPEHSKIKEVFELSSKKVLKD